MKWLLICVFPRFVARWLMFGGGKRTPLPASWIPYMFGRALDAQGKRVGS